MAPEPFKISIPQEKIDNLKTKVSLAEFPDELEGSEWDLGAPLADVARLTKVWLDWDWRLAEERLNQLPHYHTGIKIDGFEELDIHFIWQKSEVKNAIPLLFVHGCIYFSTTNHISLLLTLSRARIIYRSPIPPTFSLCSWRTSFPRRSSLTT